MAIIKPSKSITSKSFFEKRRTFLIFGAAELLNLAIPFPRFVFAEISKENTRMMQELISQKPLEAPLLIFHGYQDDPDYEIKHRIAQDAASQHDLVKIIQKDIGLDNNIEITFESLESELLFVPESRKKYAEAYRSYCINVIDSLFAKIKMEIPMGGIVNLVDEYPKILENQITAFIVHRLGKKYKTVCSFTNANGEVSRKFTLEGAFFSNQLGSVELEILCPQKGVFDLKRKDYTIWQNNTDNLVNILTIPIEETLHYIMGQYTDKKITEDLKHNHVQHVSELKKISDHWMAVEEAVVGGLVHTLLPGLAYKYAIYLSDRDMQLSFMEKSHLPQYRFRKTGIAYVKKTGFQQAIDMYKNDPAAFARRINA